MGIFLIDVFEMGKANLAMALLIALILSSLYLFLMESPIQAISSSSLDDNWPMFRQNPANTGATTSLAPISPPSVVWSTGPKDQNLYGSPAVVNGIVYVSGLTLYAFNASNGEMLWRIINGGLSSPVVVDGIVYTGGGGAAYNASTGVQIWKSQENSNYLTVANGYYYSINQEGLVARNASTGFLIWGRRLIFPLSKSPAVEYGYLYFGTVSSRSRESIMALNASTGDTLWEFEGEGGKEISSSPAIYEGYLYSGSSDYNVYCLDAFTGKKIWNYTTGRAVNTSPAVSEGYVYIGSDDGNVYALNASTGAKIWNYTTYYSPSTYQGVRSSSVVANGAVFIGSDDGNLYAFNASTGTKLWNYTLQSLLNRYRNPQHLETSPAIANGRIYMSSLEHFITVLGMSDAPPPSPNFSSPPAPSPVPSEFTEQLLVATVIIGVIVIGTALIVHKRIKKKDN